MALEKKIDTSIGVPARYHRIIWHEVRFIPEPAMEGCEGSVFVRVASYASQEAREAGAEPLANQTVRVRFGAQLTDAKVMNREREVPVLSIQSDEPTRAEIYAALMGSPTFEGAVEA